MLGSVRRDFGNGDEERGSFVVEGMQSFESSHERVERFIPMPGSLASADDDGDAEPADLQQVEPNNHMVGRLHISSTVLVS